MNNNVHYSFNPLIKTNVNIRVQEKQSVVCLIAHVSKLAFLNCRRNYKKCYFKNYHEKNKFFKNEKNK